MNELRNIASVSWPDYLVFGEEDNKPDTIDKLRRAMQRWRDELGARTVHWREVRTRVREAGWYAPRGNPKIQRRKILSIEWDDFEVVPQLAHELAMKAHLYFSPLDEGRPLLPKRERETSYRAGHGKLRAMRAKHVTWQTRWSRAHPECTVVDRTGKVRQWGVLCYAYPEVRAYMCQRIDRLLTDYAFDGVFLCLRSQARPADFADQFAFNEPVRQDYLARYGRDIQVEDFDLQLWRDLLGSYFTQFLRELREFLRRRGIALAVGVPRGDVIGPPMGNWTLQWREWIAEDLIDELIIDQNSSRCPSWWHQLWAMHRGYGYLQNYSDGYNMRSLREDLDQTYDPALADTGVKLYVARQWSPRSEPEEAELLAHLSVAGLVFSTFRHDNPEAIARGKFVT
jgi:hypothetical protein